MAYDLALGRPERFRALVALSSWLPEAVVQGLGPNPARAALPTLLIHGTRDPMIAIDNARKAKAQLEGLGMHVAWGEYEMGHEITPGGAAGPARVARAGRLRVIRGRGPRVG